MSHILSRCRPRPKCHGQNNWWWRGRRVLARPRRIRTGDRAPVRDDILGFVTGPQLGHYSIDQLHGRTGRYFIHGRWMSYRCMAWSVFSKGGRWHSRDPGELRKMHMRLAIVRRLGRDDPF